MGKISKEMLVKLLQCILLSSQEGHFNEVSISECAANLTSFIKAVQLFIFARLLDADAANLALVHDCSSLQLYRFLTNNLDDSLRYKLHINFCCKLLYFFPKLEVIYEPEQCRALYRLCCLNRSIVEKIIDIMS